MKPNHSKIWSWLVAEPVPGRSKETALVQRADLKQLGAAGILQGFRNVFLGPSRRAANPCPRTGDNAASKRPPMTPGCAWLSSRTCARCCACWSSGQACVPGSRARIGDPNASGGCQARRAQRLSHSGHKFVGPAPRRERIDSVPPKLLGNKFMQFAKRCSGHCCN